MLPPGLTRAAIRLPGKRTIEKNQKQTYYQKLFMIFSGKNLRYHFMYVMKQIVMEKMKYMNSSLKITQILKINQWK